MLFLGLFAWYYILGRLCMGHGEFNDRYTLLLGCMFGISSIQGLFLTQKKELYEGITLKGWVVFNL